MTTGKEKKPVSLSVEQWIRVVMFLRIYAGDLPGPFSREVQGLATAIDTQVPETRDEEAPTR